MRLVSAGSLALALAFFTPSPAGAQSPTPGGQGARSAAAAGGLDNWTGFYAGGSFGHSSATFTGTVTFADVTVNGQTFTGQTITFNPAGVGHVSGGGQVGYAIQVMNQFIAGAEFSIEGSSMSVSQTAGDGVKSPFIPTDTFSAQTTSRISLRGRIGAPLMRNQLLVYFVGGVSFAGVTMSGTFPSTGAEFPAAAGSESHHLTGAEFGGGAEFAIRKDLTVGGEFCHRSYASSAFNLGDVVVVAPPQTSEPALAMLGMSGNEISVRLNYRFRLR